MEFLLVHRMSQPSLIHLVSTLICDLSQRKNPAACDIKKSALSVKARVRYYINNDSDDYRYAWGFASSPFFLLDVSVHSNRTAFIFPYTNHFT